jgi:hypothetical protein
MALTITANPASAKQINWIHDLLAERPNWTQVLDNQPAETAFDILGNVGSSDPKFIAMSEARILITLLLKIPATKTVTPANGVPTPFTRLQTLLATLKPGYYALPREDVPGTFRFYRVVEVEQGTWQGRRFVNLLIGSPHGWERQKPTMVQQLAIARQLTRDWKVAARAYAQNHQKCARCNADLSNPRSQIALVGEHCAGEWGWPW